MMYKIVHGLVDIPWEKTGSESQYIQCFGGFHAYKYIVQI